MSTGRRVIAWIGVVLMSAALFALALAAVAIAAILVYREVAEYTDPSPHPMLWAHGIAIVSFLLIGALLGACVTVSVRVVFGRWSPQLMSTFTAVALAVMFGFQMFSPPPQAGPHVEPLFTFSSFNRWPSDPRFDVLVLIDPGDPAARRLAAAAREAPREVVAPPSATQWDLTWSVATIGGARRGWTHVQPPTRDRADVAAALAGLPQDARPDTPALARAFHDIVTGEPDGLWRPRTRRAIVLVLDRIPTPAQTGRLGSALWRIASEELPAPLLQTLGGRSERPQLIVVTDDEPPVQILVTAGLALPVPGTVIPERSALAAAEGALVGLPDEHHAGLALDHRPVIKLDDAERFGPIDVDTMLAERNDDGEPVHEVCRRQIVLPDECRPVRSGYDLAAGGSYLDIAGGVRFGDDLPPDVGPGATAKPRIYYQVDDDGPRVHLDYWWFFRFNVSPVRTASACLAGVWKAKETCFDHEGDWEGVTVTLDVTGDEPKVESVVYDAHGHGTRYGRRDLEQFGALDETERPIVYVAWGSHASYPTECDGSGGLLDCPQGDVRHPKWFPPEGVHDGDQRWPPDDAACDRPGCLAPLPVTPGGTPALWGAFDGRWGKPGCTSFTRICVKAEGPESPSEQARYLEPSRVH